MCLFWKKIPIWRLKERCSPYHLQIRLDCFRAGTDQIHCERKVIIITTVIITIIIIKSITGSKLDGWDDPQIVRKSLPKQDPASDQGGEGAIVKKG